MDNDKKVNSSEDYGPHANVVVSFFSGRVFWIICVFFCIVGIAYGLTTGGLLSEDNTPGVKQWRPEGARRIEPTKRGVSKRDLEESSTYQRFKASH